MKNNNSHCLNCGQELLGNFCHRCGQQNVPINITFMELVRDFFGDMFNFDSRFYRTMIPLLTKPGFLTLEFFKGRRIPYVPPLRLYLFVSFLLFLWLASVGGLDLNLNNSEATSGFNVNITNNEVERIRANTDAAIAEMEKSETPEWVKALVIRISNNWLQIAENPQTFLNLLASRLPYLMFLLLPVFALIMWLHYALSGYNYLQHFVFTLHFHSFVFVTNLVFSIIDKILTWDFFGWALLIFNVYIVLAMRRTYGSSVAGCIAKTLSILTVYGTVLGTAFLGFLFLNVLNYR